MSKLLAVMCFLLTDPILNHISWLFQLESSVQLFLTLLILWCLCWIKRRVALLLRSSRDLDLKVGFSFSKERITLGCIFHFSLIFHILTRCVEGTLCPYHHDRHSDCTSVVHLWLREGLLQAPTSSSSWDARVSEEEAWVNWLDRSMHIWTESAFGQCWQKCKRNFYIFDSLENRLFLI